MLKYLRDPTLDVSAPVPRTTEISAQICKLRIDKAVNPLTLKLVKSIEKSKWSYFAEIKWRLSRTVLVLAIVG